MRLLLLALSIGRASTESPFDAFHHAFPKPHGKPGIFIKGDTVFVHSNNDQPCKPDHRVGNWSVTGGCSLTAPRVYEPLIKPKVRTAHTRRA